MNQAFQRSSPILALALRWEVIVNPNTTPTP